MDFTAIMAYAFGLILLYIIGKILLLPIRILLKLVYNGIVGGIGLLILNYFGSFLGIHIAINAITALVVGFLGVPGLIMLIILKYVIHI